MRKWWETGIIILAVTGFWGMIYPDLCFIADVCKVEQKDAEYMEYGETGDGMWEPDVYTRICQAQPEQIKVKSRFLEFFLE